jgi:outer membrane receptor protein involved in Fe transport
VILATQKKKRWHSVQALALAAGSTPAQAQAQVQADATPAAAQVEIDIAAQPLADALAQLARRYSLRLDMPAALVAGRTAPAVRGTFSVSDALRAVLADSRLTASITDGTLRLVRAVSQLETVLVSAVRQRATATRQDAELRDLPQSVAVIPQQVLQERAFTRIEDIGYATVNLLPNAPYTGVVSIGFFSRGFNGSTVLVDGYNAGVVSGFTSNIYELASVDKVEVLRGPASVLYGQGNPGGVANLTLKRPLFEPGFATELQFDRWGQRRGTVDLNQPLSDAAALRVIGVLEDSDTSLGRHWKLQLGLRYDRLETDGYSDAQFTLSDQQQRSRNTPSAGVVYQPGESTALYANYSESFLPQFGRNRFGSVLDPEIGKSVELGLKQEFLNCRLALTAAVFEIEKSGVLTIDPQDPCCNVNGGAARSRGVEFELAGRLTRVWQVRAGLGTSDAKWIRSNDFPVGASLVGVSRATALLGAAFRPQAEGWTGAWFAADVSYAGKREWLPTIDDYKLPAYSRLDLTAGWSLDRWEWQVNLKSATDERIVLSNGYGLVAPDAPRTLAVTLRYRTGAL